MSYTVNTHTSPALKCKHSANIYSFGMLHTLEQFQFDQTFATANRIVKLLKGYPRSCALHYYYFSIRI